MYSIQCFTSNNLLPREPVRIIGGSGPDPLAEEIHAARVADGKRADIKRRCVLPEYDLAAQAAGGHDEERKSGHEPGDHGDGREGAGGGRLPFGWVLRHQRFFSPLITVYRDHVPRRSGTGKKE